MSNDKKAEITHLGMFTQNKDSVKNGLYVGIFGITGSVIGGNFVFNISESILNISFGIFLIFVSINMFFTSK